MRQKKPAPFIIKLIMLGAGFFLLHRLVGKQFSIIKISKFSKFVYFFMEIIVLAYDGDQLASIGLSQ